jgi:hypothetical protein
MELSLELEGLCLAAVLVTSFLQVGLSHALGRLVINGHPEFARRRK